MGMLTNVDIAQLSMTVGNDSYYISLMSDSWCIQTYSSSSSWGVALAEFQPLSMHPRKALLEMMGLIVAIVSSIQQPKALLYVWMYVY